MPGSGLKVGITQDEEPVDVAVADALRAVLDRLAKGGLPGALRGTYIGRF